MIFIILLLNGLKGSSQEIIDYTIINTNIYELIANLAVEQDKQTLKVNITDSEIQQEIVERFGVKPFKCNRISIKFSGDKGENREEVFGIGFTYPGYDSAAFSYAFIFCFENETVLCSTNSSEEHYFLDRPIEIMSLFYECAKRHDISDNLIKSGLKRILYMSLKSCIYMEEYKMPQEFKDFGIDLETLRPYDIDHDYSLLYEFLKDHFVVGADSNYLLDTLMEYVAFHKSRSTLPKGYMEKNIMYDLLELVTYANPPSVAPRLSPEIRNGNSSESADTVQYYVINKNLQDLTRNLEKDRTGIYLNADISNSDLQNYILQRRSYLKPIDCNALYMMVFDEADGYSSNSCACGFVHSGNIAGYTILMYVFSFEKQTVLCTKSIGEEYFFLDRPLQTTELFYRYAKQNNVPKKSINRALCEILSMCLSDNIFYEYFKLPEYELFDLADQSHRWYEIDHDYSLLYEFLKDHFVVGANSDYLMNTLLEYVDYHKSRSTLSKGYMEKNILYDLIELATYANPPSVAPRLTPELKKWSPVEKRCIPGYAGTL